MSIKVVGIHHANIRLQTPEQARWFYGQVLGLQADAALPYDSAHPNFWWNVAGTASQLHTPCAPNPDGTPATESGIRHLALMVEDIAEAKRVLDQEGATYAESQNEGRGMQLRTHDPAGNIIDLFQAPASKDAYFGSLRPHEYEAASPVQEIALGRMFPA